MRVGIGDKEYVEVFCLSTDTKPTTDIINGSELIEVDTSKTYLFNEVAGDWVEQPSGGGVEVESLSVTANSTYTAPSGKAYSPVTVNVPNTYAAGDEGKVVSNGALVAQTSDSVTQNGTVDTTLINSLEVNVPQGGGAAPEKDVNFIDYDGTILYSYTADEFAALDALPANPTHEGLTAQGWNWTLADAKAQAAVACPLWIGQMYITSSGKTEIDVNVVTGRTALYLNFAVNGTAKIDWGDGTAVDTVTGTSISSTKNVAHTYPSTGKYTISVKVESGTGSLKPSPASLLTNESYTSILSDYAGMVVAVRLGSNMNIGAGAFNSCKALKTITLPIDEVCDNGSNVFANVYRLNCLVVPRTSDISASRLVYSSLNTAGCRLSLPKIAGAVQYPLSFYQKYAEKGVICEGVTELGIGGYQSSANLQIILPSTLKTLGANSLSGHECLAVLTIPASVETIGNAAVKNNTGLNELHFMPTTPPSAGSNAFNALPTTCKIYVPTGTLSAYTSASNYPSSSTYTYVEE